MDDVQPVVGLDLGTGFSCISYWRRSINQFEVIPNKLGDRLTPSVVAFTSDEILVGTPATNQHLRNPKNTVCAVKRLMGRKWSDAGLQEDAKQMSYMVVQDPNGSDRPSIQVKLRGEDKYYSPEEVSSMIIKYLVGCAEEFLGRRVESLVITVPAYFNDAQRQATKDAVAIAGPRVLRIVNEPTAAALAYGLGDATRPNRPKHQTVLVYDLGSGTFDTTLLDIADGVVSVKSTSGNTRLGGMDFNLRIRGFVLERLRKHHGEGPVSELTRKQHYLIERAAESAKRCLSSQVRTEVEVDLGGNLGVFVVDLSRAKFDHICADLFEMTMVGVQQVLKDSNLSKSDVDEVVLVGGSSRIPKVKEILSGYFEGKVLNGSVSVDEVVAAGASVCAAIVSKVDMKESSLLLIDVNPLSLGIEVAGGFLEKVVVRNSTIPTKETKVFTTLIDNQAEVELRIFEGERLQASDCHLLGRFTLAEIPASLRGRPQIDVTFEIDANGMLTVSAQDRATGKKNTVKVGGSSRLDSDQIQLKLLESELNSAYDKNLSASRDANYKLENSEGNLSRRPD